MKIDRLKLAESVNEVSNDLGQVIRDLKVLQNKVLEGKEVRNIDFCTLLFEKTIRETREIFDQLDKITLRLLDDRDYLQNLQYYPKRHT